jgi:topoisomerase-4 subunit A
MDALKSKLSQVRKHLANLVDYAVSFLEGIAKRLEKDWPRRTELTAFRQVDVKEASRRDLPLRYDESTGYLGTSVSGGETLFPVSPYDKVLAIRHNGVYTAMTVPEKLFVDKGMLFCGNAGKEELLKNVFTVVYKDGATGFAHIKRCRIEQYINNKDYFLVPPGAQVLLFSTDEDFEFTVVYTPKPRMKVKEEAFSVSDFEVKGLKAQGVRLAAKEAASAQPGVTRSARRAATAAARDGELFPEKARKAKKGTAKGRGTSPAKKGLRARAEAIAAKTKASPKKPAPSAKTPRKK